ncbi:MAG: ribose 5-phosphate isomerase B [Bacteroidia bacterium]|nr:ribose 5-phosphate isomerase B [Bacteroidota bacterium]
MNQPNPGSSTPSNWTQTSWVIGSDHAGFDTKEFLRSFLQSQGAQVRDMGCYSPESVDYPQVAHALATAVVENSEGLRGLLLCGSGNGVCISANRIPGARAALCWLPELASLARSHNNANILCLPARFVSHEQALVMLEAFAFTPFEGGRHQRRVAMIDPGASPIPPIG